MMSPTAVHTPSLERRFLVRLALAVVAIQMLFGLYEYWHIVRMESERLEKVADKLTEDFQLSSRELFFNLNDAGALRLMQAKLQLEPSLVGIALFDSVSEGALFVGAVRNSYGVVVEQCPSPRSPASNVEDFRALVKQLRRDGVDTLVSRTITVNYDLPSGRSQRLGEAYLFFTRESLVQNVSAALYSRLITTVVLVIVMVVVIHLIVREELSKPLLKLVVYAENFGKGILQERLELKAQSAEINALENALNEANQNARQIVNQATLLAGGFYDEVIKPRSAEDQLAQALIGMTRDLKRLNGDLEQIIQTRTQALKDETEERMRLQAALRQSQKMEALGQLAGGIAHDFNNLLAVITLNADLLMTKIDPDTRAYVCARDISSACTRASEMISSLLSFARKKNLSLAPVDVNEVVQGAYKLITHALPRKVATTLELSRNSALFKGDATLIQNMLLNLCINARDAMPAGGRLRISTLVEYADGNRLTALGTPIPAGEYVVIRIADTGTGIPEALIPKIFEPFYTTKGEGQGTGLGLSMVYGLVQEHKGFVCCESVMGQGTCFSLYFPKLVA